MISDRWYDENDKEFVTKFFCEDRFTIENNYNILSSLPKIVIDTKMWDSHGFKDLFLSIKQLKTDNEISWGIKIGFYNQMCYELAHNKCAPGINLRHAKVKIKNEVYDLSERIIKRHKKVVLVYSDNLIKWANFYYALKIFYDTQTLYINEEKKKTKEWEIKQQSIRLTEFHKIWKDHYDLKTLHEHSGIYFLRNSHEMIKIGKASNISSRCSTLAGANSHPLQLIAVILLNEEESDLFALEYDLHKKYNDYHYSGEWFNLPNNIINTIISTMKQKEIIACKQVNQILHPRHKHLSENEVIEINDIDYYNISNHYG